jgi:hypothetical protein
MGWDGGKMTGSGPRGLLLLNSSRQSQRRGVGSCVSACWSCCDWSGLNRGSHVKGKPLGWIVVVPDRPRGGGRASEWQTDDMMMKSSLVIINGCPSQQKFQSIKITMCWVFEPLRSS